MAVATLTSASYVPATLTCLHSFLETNRWFDGEFVVLHEDLDREQEALLGSVSPKLRTVRVSAELTSRVDRIVELRPRSRHQRTNFFYLDLFRLRGYRRVLLCDADILFLGDVRELFDTEAPLLACAEGIHYLGQGRDPDTFEALPLPACEGRALFSNTFNSGLLSLAGSLLNDREYEGLLDRASFEFVSKLTVGLTDQALLNAHFAGRQQLASGKYNYFVRLRRFLERDVGLRFSDARVLHFAGPCKPWNAQQTLAQGVEDPVFLRAVDLWHRAFRRAVGAVHMKQVSGRLSPASRLAKRRTPG